MSDSGPVARQGASSRAVASGVLGDSAVPAAGPTACCHSANASRADPNTPAPTTVRSQHESMSQAYQWSVASPS